MDLVLPEPMTVRMGQTFRPFRRSDFYYSLGYLQSIKREFELIGYGLGMVKWEKVSIDQVGRNNEFPFGIDERNPVFWCFAITIQAREAVALPRATIALPRYNLNYEARCTTWEDTQEVLDHPEEWSPFQRFVFSRINLQPDTAEEQMAEDYRHVIEVEWGDGRTVLLNFPPKKDLLADLRITFIPGTA